MDCKEGTLPLSFIHKRLPSYPNVSKLKVCVSFEELVHIDGEPHHHIDALGHGTVEVVVLGAVVQEIVKSSGYLEGCAETSAVIISVRLGYMIGFSSKTIAPHFSDSSH